MGRPLAGAAEGLLQMERDSTVEEEGHRSGPSAAATSSQENERGQDAEGDFESEQSSQDSQEAGTTGAIVLYGEQSGQTKWEGKRCRMWVAKYAEGDRWRQRKNHGDDGPSSPGRVAESIHENEDRGPCRDSLCREHPYR